MLRKVKVYDREFNQYSRPAIHPRVSELLAGFPRGRLLDLPAGSGALSYRLHREGFDVTACDLIPSCFEPSEIPCVQGDLRAEFPFDDQSFDYATFVEGPEHAENPFLAFREFSRVLKLGGRLVITLPNYTSFQSRLRYFLFGSVEPAINQDHFQNDHHGIVAMVHITPLTYTQLRFFLETAGFVVESIHRDKQKWKQWLAWPITAAIQGYSWLKGRNGEQKYWAHEANSNVILQGGNTLVIVARKERHVQFDAPKVPEHRYVFPRPESVASAA